MTVRSKDRSGLDRGSPVENGGGEGSRTPVPDRNSSRDYMLSQKWLSATGTPSDVLPRCLVGMKKSRVSARRLRINPCLLWRSSGPAGVNR